MNFKKREIPYLTNNFFIRRIFALIIFSFILSVQLNATTYYTRGTNLNWNANTSWSTVTYSGTAASSYPVGGDTVKIDDGHSVIVNTSSACAELTIGRGTSGTLQYGSTGAFTLTVTGNITVNSGATFWYNSNNTRTHTLNLSGNFVNNGTVDFVYDVNDRVNITFSGSANSVVSGSGSWTLNNVTLSKTSTAYYLEIQSAAFEAAIATLATTAGTYIHNNSGSYSINAASSTDYTINQNSAFKIPQGSLTFSAGANRLYLEGSLYVNGGSVYVGSTAGAYGFRYQQVGSVIPYLEVSSGTLTVYGGINEVFGSTTDAFNFYMTGGTILVNSGSTGTTREVFYINDISGSSFYMSGGTIILQAPNYNGSSTVDFGICANNGTVTSTGGVVQFGNASTGNNKTFSFMPYPNVVQPNFFVTGPSANTITLAPYSGTTSDFKLLSLKIDNGKTFDVRSNGGANGDSKIITLTSTYNGTYAFYNDGTFTARSGEVTLNGSSAQSIGGASVTTFYDLTITASSDVTLTGPQNVSHMLTMTSGKLITTSTNILTCTSTANATIGSSTSYVDGPMIHTIASSSSINKTYPIGKGSSYRPAVLTVTHSNATSVTYRGEVINTSASSLGYSLPASLANVSTVRYWNFNRQNVANFTNATIQLYYDTDDSVSNRLSVAVAHDGGSSNWLSYGGTGTANYTGSITSSSITSFNTKFALGFPPGGLPIELISFDAKPSESKVLCEWSTATEINNNYFTVERSTDGLHYDSVFSVDGAGNSSIIRNYSAVDEHPINGDSYYRLKQTDNDGHFNYSNSVHVYMNAVTNSYTFFPNPSERNYISISKNGEDLDQAKIFVKDILGRSVESIAKLSKNKTEIQLSIDPSSYSKNSTYIVSIISGNSVVKEKVMINKQ